jgi:hypothetical protein
MVLPKSDIGVCTAEIVHDTVPCTEETMYDAWLLWISREGIGGARDVPQGGRGQLAPGISTNTLVRQDTIFMADILGDLVIDIDGETDLNGMDLNEVDSDDTGSPVQMEGSDMELIRRFIRESSP